MECSACDGEVHPINDCCNWDAPLTSGGARSSKHIGELELMTWGFDIATDNPVYARIFREMTEILGYDVRDDMSSGEAMRAGWGGAINIPAVSEWQRQNPDVPIPFNAIFASSGQKLKRCFEDECGGSLPEFFRLQPSAFRWTCCGLAGDSVRGCDHHGVGCQCDYCPDSASRRLMHPQGEAARLGVEAFAASMGPPPYEPRQENRFLRLGSPECPKTEWELAAGVPWSPDVHIHLPRCFRQQARQLLLCWQRSDLPSGLALLVLAFLHEAEALNATTACAECGKGGCKTLACSKCKQVFYCGRACQAAAWEGHKKECKRIRKEAGHNGSKESPMVAMVNAIQL
jgi:hypothetical protein